MKAFDHDAYTQWLMQLAYVDGQMKLADLSSDKPCVTWRLCEFTGYGWILQYPGASERNKRTMKPWGCQCEWSELENGGSVWRPCPMHQLEPGKAAVRGARYSKWELALIVVGGLSIGFALGVLSVWFFW